MIHQFNRFAQRLAIRIQNIFNPSVQLSEYELEGLKICRKLILKKDTILLMSPISGKRYIKSDDGLIFIVIEDNNITIVNHQYSYNIRLSEKSYSKVKLTFDTAVESRREAMEAEIKSNVKHSLHTIFKNLSNENI